MEILHLARCKNCKQVFGILRRTMLTQQRCKEPSAYSGRQQHLFSHWYDTDGERTVKTSGENEAIYVNSEFSGGNTGTARFSLYVSPYLVAGQGGKYTKHIYVGSQRIVSKLGDLASYGADPRRIPYAGNEADGLTVDYKAKYNQQLQSIKDNYKTFDIPYNGEDNDDYVNGQGFCCNDGTPEAAQARAMARTRAANGNFKSNDEYEKMQFYYHPDHLGSSSYITNLDGEVSQHIEYVPFGEVFIEERNNTWNTPYLFNAKELDEETGMYYYGARYYEQRISLWMSVDPISNYDPRNSENYLDGEHNEGVYYSFNLNPYVYCYQSPVILVDPNGKQVKAIKEWWMRNQMTTRTLGFIKGVGGVVEAGIGAVGGVATSWTGAGGVVGGLAVVHGSDVAASGFTQMITGNETSSFTSQGLQAAGMSKDNAELVDGGIGIILSAGAGSVYKASVSTSKISAGMGYATFNSFKQAKGSAGPGKAWHHIVEQTSGNVSKFGAYKIHNTNNLIKLPYGAGSIHAKVSGYYSSIQPFTGGKTVHQWLSTQSYDAQYKFGIETLKKFGWKP